MLESNFFINKFVYYHKINGANLKKIILICCIIFYAHIFAFAQSGSGTVYGVVSEEKSGENVISISVVLYPEENITTSKPVRGAITNKFGAYTIPNIPSGEYYLVTRAVGYQTFTKKIKIKENEKIKLDIQLINQDVKGQEIIVEAERLEDANSRLSTIMVSPAFVSKMPSLGGEVDVFRTLQLLPGVKQATELSSGLYVRGGSPDQNLNLLDGVIVYNPSHLGGFLSVFNNDALRDIKLVKGAFPAEYGGRLSSVLDMTMKEGTKEKFSGSGGVSLISSRLTLEGPINENSTFMISGRRMYLDLLMWAAMSNKDEIATYYFYDLNAKVNYKISEKDRIFVSGFLCNDVLDEPKKSDYNFDVFWGNKTANLRWMHIVSPVLFTNSSLIYTDYSFNTDIFDKENPSNNLQTKSQIRDIMLRTEAQYFPHQDHRIKSGAEIIWHNFQSRFTTDLIPKEMENPFNTKDLNSLEAALFLQDEWKISELLNTNIGTRFYYFQEANYFALEPRMSFSYSLSDATSLSLSGALAHQFLHLIVRNDITLPTDLWFPSTSKIKPSKSWQVVLGAEHILNKGEYLISIEAYYKDIQNLLEYKDSATFSFGIPLEDQFTSGRGVAYGVELFVNKRIGNFTGWIGYTLAWTKRQFNELNNGKWFNPRYDRRHDVSLVLTYELGERWELGAAWIYGTGQAYTMPTGIYSYQSPIPGDNYKENKYQYTERNGARLPSFHKLDLNFIYKFSWFDVPWQLSLNIYNAYNRKNPFAWYIKKSFNEKGEEYPVVKQLTLFPIIPTIGISFKF